MGNSVLWWSRVLAGVAFLLCAFLECSAYATSNVTASMEVVGNPYFSYYKDGTARVYGRNVWDLKVYNGKLYVGAGNSSNEGPGGNIGPVPIYRYDPVSGTFTTAYSVYDEQIDAYYAFSDGLWTPGHDPREDWTSGNVYHMTNETNNTWLKWRNLPDEVHDYVMAEYGGKLFAGGYYIYASSNHATNWTKLSSQSRVHAFLQFPDQLYAVTEYTYTYRYTGTNFSYVSGLSGTVPYPNTTLSSTARKIIRPCQLTGISNSMTAYIGAYIHNDHQSLPFGAYIANSTGSSLSFQKITNFPSTCRPWDIMVTNGVVYVLLEQTNSVPTINRVWSSTNLTAWTEQFYFEYPTFARSFECLNGDFFFGMGCEVTNTASWKQSELIPETGHILRLKQIPAAPELPLIVTHPVSSTFNYGRPATFMIFATGTYMSYQWQKNGTNIAGQTSVSCIIPAVVQSDGGTYRCVVSNSAGSVTSSNAILTVNMKPVITVQPVSRTNLVGQTATFSLTATGLGLGYQWQRDTTNISGATSASYTSTATVASDNGATFRCVVTNAYGTNTSSSVSLTVVIPLVISEQPEDVAVNVGATASFYIAVTGTSPRYQWQRNMTNISGATSVWYTTAATVTGDNGATFRCVVSNTAGSVTSRVAMLTVTTGLPVITVHPSGKTNFVGQVETFSVTATGSGLMYQWQKARTNISGATSASYTTPILADVDNGVRFRCVVSNTVGAVNSKEAFLTVLMPPTVNSITISQGRFVIAWSSMQGILYKVYTVTSLQTGSWSNVYQVSGDGNQKSYTNTDAVAWQQFFRLGVTL